jgi:glycosyltransferase involved in cell wall biosynthesis
MSSVSVVLPLLTARPDVREVALAWTKALRATSEPWEILLIDDADAVAPAAAWLKEAAGLRLIKHAAPCGLGAALQTGIDLAVHDWLLLTVLNRQFNPSDALKLCKRSNADVVAAYRVRPVPAWMRGLDECKRLLSRLLLGDAPERRDTWLGASGFGRRFMARRIFGVAVRDPECGLVLARRDIFKQLRLQSRGDFAWTEILAKANHLGKMIAECPVSEREPPPPRTPCARDAHNVFHHPDFGPPLNSRTCANACAPMCSQE